METLIGNDTGDITSLKGILESQPAIQLIAPTFGFQNLNHLTHSEGPSDLESIIAQEEEANVSSSDSDLDIKYEDILSAQNTPRVDLLQVPTIGAQDEEYPLVDEMITIIQPQNDLLDEFPLFRQPLGNDEAVKEEPTLDASEQHQHSSSILNDQQSSISPCDTKIEVRRSKRLKEFYGPDRTVCDPMNFEHPLKPAIKQKDSLNMIVDSSSGQLNEATKYATQINSQNCIGIQLPNNAEEIVTIPLKGARRAVKNPKVALVKAYEVKPREQKNDISPVKIGFYSKAQYIKYCTSPSKVTKVEHPSKNSKRLRWAEDLEW